MLGMDDCNAAVAYNDIARRLFGSDAFLTSSIVKREVTRWIGYVVALAWHRWRNAPLPPCGWANRSPSKA